MEGRWTVLRLVAGADGILRRFSQGTGCPAHLSVDLRDNTHSFTGGVRASSVSLLVGDMGDIIRRFMGGMRCLSSASV